MPPPEETPEDVESWLQAQAAQLWPAGLGSLSLRKTRCARAGCEACATGEQHPSYVLYGRNTGGRRASIYVPDDLADEVERLLSNGRALQDLLYEAGRRYTVALKRRRARRA